MLLRAAGPDPVLIEDAVQWAAQQRRAGHPVFVHCAHGHGRSTVVLCAALVGCCACLQTAKQVVQALTGADSGFCSCMSALLTLTCLLLRVCVGSYRLNLASPKHLRRPSS